MTYFECSAKEGGDKVTDIFVDFARRMMKREEEKIPKQQTVLQKKDVEKQK